MKILKSIRSYVVFLSSQEDIEKNIKRFIFETVDYFFDEINSLKPKLYVQLTQLYSIENYKTLFTKDYSKKIRFPENRIFFDEFIIFYSSLSKYLVADEQVSRTVSDYNYEVNRRFEEALFILNQNTYSVKLLPFLGFKALVTIDRGNSLIGRKYLDSKNLVTNVIVNTPFIANSFSNTRTGMFSETTKELSYSELESEKFLLLAVKVGRLMMHIYCHIDFIHHALTVFNLFSIATQEEIKSTPPKGILFFGIFDRKLDKSYYFDKKNDCYIGYIYNNQKNDYFGYMKKMLLTLYNLHHIDNHKLPIHGAMVKIRLINNIEKNIIIVGDSGAGKSETLEAFRLIGKNMIQSMEIIFDDMGIVEIVDSKCYASGTEIGAFVRMDDLDSAYAYQNLNSSILINPTRTNARLVTRVTSYETITKNHTIDYFLYANNYEKNENKIKIYDSLDEAINVFSTGKRLAKGTTSEVGLVENFFANPFGPLQKQKTVEKLIKTYFQKFIKEKIVLGEIYTQLGLDGYKFEGPRSAATYLLNLILDK